MNLVSSTEQEAFISRFVECANADGFFGMSAGGNSDGAES
jgi:hypothetical protein